MITLMRRHRKALQIGLLVVIAAFVASLFVFGATGSRGGGDPRDTVATVNGEVIPIERYQRRYKSYMEAYAQIYRDRFSPEMAERLGLPQQVVGDLVQEALIELPSIVAATGATDEEIAAYLAQHPDEFRQLDRRRVQYVTISARDFVTPVSDADVEKYYHEHAAEFESPRQAHAAHILARVGE